ncbi:hypothetical protein IE81DRAFT_49447 [Ceraceosorus guamensis]|uniref:PH domain-containing protein n=1 Tax=Ceraceosorus guamensis TaxID=1522189 RepID=A0A316VSF9_9BASI|nr:hypothetical protein IE81DRAFT_49447 [Ceraceosorus guamensis]PWN39121.1 hypothetical protein IE81DRAFT_49447 [Ceraceosorus guamensis]
MSATAPLSPQHSPHSPMLSLSPLGVHAKLPTPPHATQALEVLSSSFNFPEPPSRLFRDGFGSARSSPRTSRAGSPPPPTMRKKRSPRNSAKRLTQESAKARPPMPDLPSPAQNDFPASAISAPTSPANSSAHPSSQPLGVSGNRPSHSSAPPEQSRSAPTTQHPHAHIQAANSSDVSSARLEHALGNAEYASDAGVVAQEAGGLGLHMAEAVEADEGDVEQRLSFLSGSGQRQSAVPASQRVSSGSSIYSDQQEYLAQEGDETGDGSAGGLSLSSDSDSYMPVTPATPGHSFSSSFSTSSTWRPRELTLARADAQSERERSLAGLALNPRSASPMMSPWSSSSTIGVPRDRLSPAPGASSPSHLRGVAGSSSANTSLSSGGGHNSGAAGTRGLMLASAAAPPNSARNFPPLALALPTSTGATATDAAPPRSSPLAPRSRFVSAPGAALTSQAPLRSPLPVLSRGPAFPPARDATLESMAAERVPNEDLGALQAMLPHRRLLSGSSARLLSPALHSASAQGVISPIASKPSWEKPFGEARSASSDSQYGNEARPMDPEAFVAAMQAASAAEVAAALEARKQLRSTASASQLAEEVKSAPSARPQMPTRSRSQSFLRSSSMTRRRAPPPPPLLLATAPSNPDMAGAISKDTSAPTTKDSTLDAASSSVVPDDTLEAAQESPEFVTAPGISSSPSFEMITHSAGDQDQGQSRNLLAPLSLPLAGSASPMSAAFHTPLASPANMPSPESESRSLDDSLMMAVVEAQIDTAIVDPLAEAGDDIAMPQTSRVEEEHITADAPDEALEVLVDSPLQTPSNELTADPRAESRESARALGASSSLSVRPGSLEQPNTAYFDFDSDSSDAPEGIREPMIFRKMKTRSTVQESEPEPEPEREQMQRLSVADVRSSLTSGSEAADAAESALGGRAFSEAEAASARESTAGLSLSAKSDEAAGAAPFEFDDADAESGDHESVAVMRRSSSWGNLEPFEERRVSSPNSSVQGRTSIPPTISFRTSIFKHLDPKGASGPKGAPEARADISPFDTDGGDEDPLVKASSRPSAAVTTEDVLADMLSRNQEVRISHRVEPSKLARSSSQVAPAGPPPSEPLPAPPPGSSLRRSSRSVGRMSRAERTSLAATSQPQAEPTKMPQTAPSRPKRPSGVELEQLDLQPSPMPNLVPSTEPLPQGRWKADAHLPLASGASPERPVHGAEGRSQPLRSRSRPNLTVRTNSEAVEQAENLQARPRPPVPRSKASLVPEVPSFGYMGPSTPLDSAMMSPTSGAAGPFSAFSSSSFSDRSTFEPTSSRWSSGSDSEAEASKLAARKAAAKSKKAAKGPQLTSRTSSSSLGQGSMGPPPTPVKKSSFFSGLGLRKKSLTNAAAGAAGVSPASSVGAPSPRVMDAASEFPFPASTGPSPSVAASAEGARTSTSLHSRNRGGSTSSRASNTTSIGQSLTNRPSLASLRSITSYDPSRRPSVSAESFASPAISGPPSPALEGMPRGFDSVHRRPSNTGLGIDMNGSSSNGPSEPSVRASQGLRSARASLNSLRASRDLAVIRASGESDEDLAASAMSPKSTRRRSQTIAAGDGRMSNRASRQTPLSSIESPSKTAEGGNRVRETDAATDDLDDTPRVAYASLPGSRRESVTSPSVARANAKRYFETDHEALDALGSRLYQAGAGDAESQTGTAPNSPTVPSRVSSIRRHERSGSKGRQSPSPSLLRHSPSGSLLRHSPSPSLTRSISASLLRAMSPEVQPSPPPRTTSKPKRLIEKYNGTALPHYPSLTDLGRAWVAQHPNEPLQAASGPRMMARILDGVSKRRQHAGSGSKTPSDASTDDYGSSDGGGAGDHTNSIRSNGHGSAPQRGGDQAGGGGGDDPDGRRNQQSRADSHVDNANGSDESEDESDDYGSQSDEDLALGDALGAGHILGSSSQSAGSSRSESSDDVPLGDRVGNAAALQKRLQDQERKAQIQDARNALERGGVKATSSGKARRPRRVAPVPERAPDAGPLNALDLIGRLQRVQMQRGGDQATAANDQNLVASQSMPSNAARRPEAREDPHGPQAHLLAHHGLPGPSQAQRRPSPRQQTMPLPAVSAPHLRGGATRNGSSESAGRPAQARPSLGSSESQLRAMMMATSHPAQFDPQRRPSLHPSDQQQQRDFRPPVATMMMMPSSGSSSGNSSPRFPPNDHQLQLSSRMAAVIDQGHNFSAPLPPYARQGTSPRLGGSAPLRPMHSAGAAGQPEAREDAVTQARARARSVSRARPPATAIDTRVAPPMPVPALLGRAVPPPAQEVSPQKQAIPIGGPLSALSRSSNEPRSSSESPSTGLERAITAAVPSTVATAHLVQHRVYINTRQRFGTAQILPNARARDLMLDIVEKEHVPTEEAAGGGGGWVIFDCSPTHSIGEVHNVLSRKPKRDLIPLTLSRALSERPMREYESVAEVVDSRPSPDCYFLLKRTELAPFASVRAVPPSLPLLAGYVYVQDHKKKWTKRWLELREHSLFHAKSEKGKDEVLICTLSTFDVYLVDSAKYKAPKAHTFAVRSQNHISQFEKPELDYCHYFSLSDPLAHRHWYRALYTSRSYMLRQERPQLFSPPPRAAAPSAPSPATNTTNEGLKAASAAAAAATTLGVSRNTSINDRSASSAQRRIPARGATTDDRSPSHRPEGSISGQSAASASASVSAAAAAAAAAAPAPLIGRDALSTGPFEKGSLLAAAAQNQAQSEQIDLSLHERTRARQVEAARKAELAERTRRARAAGQPLIGVPTSRAT